MTPLPPISPLTATPFPSTTLFRSRPERLDRVHGRAVPDQADHLAVRLGQRHAHGRRHAVSQAAAAHRVERFALRHGRSEEHTSELQSLMRNSYAVFCLKKKKVTTIDRKC